MVFAWRWSRSCLLAGCEGCRRGARDHGRPSAGQGKFHGSRVHCGRSTLAAPLAHGQSLSWTKSVRLTWSTVHDHRSVSAAMVPSRAAWRSLLWSAPLTALWVLLTYRCPAIPSSGIPTTTHQLAAHGLIALGLWLGLEYTSLTERSRPTCRCRHQPVTWMAVLFFGCAYLTVAVIDRSRRHRQRAEI